MCRVFWQISVALAMHLPLIMVPVKFQVYKYYSCLIVQLKLVCHSF
jgi:hypothetical protein